MPRLVVWNIENYGSPPASSNRLATYAGVNAFVRHFLQSHQIDVLVMEEFKQTGIPRLATLTAVLNAALPAHAVPWQRDYVKGAFTTDPAAVAAAAVFTEAELGWGSNSEGYATVYRQGELDPLGTKMSNGIDGAPANGHVLQLNYEGVMPDVQVGTDPEFNIPAPIPAAAVLSGYPVSGSPMLIQPTQQPPAKQRRAAQLVDVGAMNASIAAIRLRTYARRPCMFQFPNPANPANPVIGMAYHAPVDNVSCVFAAQLAGVSWPVLQAAAPPLIISGDFNLAGVGARTKGFMNFLNAAAGMTAWGGHHGIEAVAVRSMVHFGRNGAELVANPALNLFMGSRRDQVFTRGLAAVASSDVANLVEILFAPVGAMQIAFRTAVLNDADILNMVNTTKPFGNGNVHWDNAYQALKNHLILHTPFTSRLSAAMLVRGYISDHLPVLTDFTP